MPPTTAPSRLLTSRGKPSLIISIPPNSAAKAHMKDLRYSKSQQLRILEEAKQGVKFMVANSLSSIQPSSPDSPNAPQNDLAIDGARPRVLLTLPECYLRPTAPPTPSMPALGRMQRRKSGLAFSDPFSKAYVARSQSSLESSSSRAATPSSSEEQIDALRSPLLPVQPRPQRSRESSPELQYSKKHIERRGRALTRQETVEDLVKREERYNNSLLHSNSIIGRQVYLARLDGTLVPELPQNLRIDIYEREGNELENWAEYGGKTTVPDFPQLPQCLQIDKCERCRSEQENWAEYWGRSSVHAWIRGVERGFEGDLERGIGMREWSNTNPVSYMDL